MHLFAFFLALFAQTAPPTSQTWYVRADGGGLYSVARADPSWGRTGQTIGCNGHADVSYAAALTAAPAGQTTNLPCALNDYRLLWDDQTTYAHVAWIINGGDTVVLDNTKAWRVGFDQGTSSNDAWCRGGSGPYGCVNPTIPAGTTSQHTRILGRCAVAGTCTQATLSEVFGGFGVGTPMNLKGAQFLDIQGLNITRHSNCVTHGSPALPRSCSTSLPLDDYDSDGVQTDLGTHDVLLQDDWIHGHTNRGILGPIGGLVTANRVNIDTNGMAGWDLDPGDGTGSPLGLLKLSYVTIQFSGCNQEYPFVDPIPVASCYSQSTGGYGDGIGTPITNMAGVSIDHSVFRYNTQDGEDFGHVILAPNLSITDSLSYGNNGGQFKWAGFQNVTFENNIAVANCLRMSQPLPGAPAGYNANLSDFCRAQDALSFDFNDAATGLIAHNTIVTYAPTTFDYQCYASAGCPSTVVNMTDNIVLGYSNPATFNQGGQAGGVGGFCGQGCNGSKFPLGTFNRASNLYFGVRGTCPANAPTPGATAGTSTGEVCADPAFVGEPAFVNESSLDAMALTLTSGSRAVKAGLPVLGNTADYDGNLWAVTPAIGALEVGSSATAGLIASTGAVPVPTPTSTPTPTPTPVPVPTPATPAPPTVQFLISPGACTTSITLNPATGAVTCAPAVAAPAKVIK